GPSLFGPYHGCSAALGRQARRARRLPRQGQGRAALAAHAEDQKRDRQESRCRVGCLGFPLSEETVKPLAGSGEGFFMRALWVGAAILALAACQQEPAGPAPDAIFHGGTIHTGVDGQATATAVSVRDG